MTAIAPKGWCPSLFTPMPAEDGWLARIKPPGAALHADAARALARAAQDYADRGITLTGRGNLQVRGLSEASIAPFGRAMVEAGLADPDPIRERRRAVMCSPLAGLHPVASTIEAMLCGEDLPAKFCVAVDADVGLPLGDIGADIAVTCTGTDCLIAPADAGSASRVPAHLAADAVRRLARAVAESGVRRMRTMVAALGARRVFAAAGLEAAEPAPSRRARNPIGWLPDLSAFGIGLPLGHLPAPALATLAALAERCGDATLRTTPWRALLLPGVANPAIVRGEAERLGLITDPADRRRLIVACTGLPGCAAASVDVQADAMALFELPVAGLVHLSGCAKGCAHPAPAPVTLVGDGGRYNLVRDGAAADIPVARGLTLRDAVAMLDATR